MIAYCGAECSKCGSYLATQTGKPEELARVAENLAKMYHADVRPEYVVCDGCRGEGRHSYFCGNLCKMRRCCETRGFYSCIECEEYPCTELLDEFKKIPGARENLERLKGQAT